MTIQEAMGILKIAIAEVEWNYPMDYTVAFEKATEALEIADRLEQVGKLGVVCKPQKYGSKTEAFADGYKQALADIRGDTE